jgi:hypothetical protein
MGCGSVGGGGGGGVGSGVAGGVGGELGGGGLFKAETVNEVDAEERMSRWWWVCSFQSKSNE